MKHEPKKRPKKRTAGWVIDESKCFEESEVKRLTQASRKLKTDGLRHRRFAMVRTWLMIELGLQAGLRVAEMASLQHGHLLTDNGRSSIIVTGKGNKKRAIWINSGFKKTCERYITLKRTFGYTTDDESYLLNNARDSQISRRALQRAFKEIIELAGLPNHYYIHCLRHTYTTFLLKASNYNYRFVQQQLGHASIRTTQVYASVLESEGKKAVEMLYR